MNTVKISEITLDRIKGSSIGHILVQAGRLSNQDMLRIVALQEKENVLFGEAAISLGILTEEEVRWALATQYSYPYPKPDDVQYGKELLVLHEPFSARVESFRSIRSALFLSGVGKLITTIAILSPDSGEGKTFVAANLAVLFAQLGARTLLLDLNFRSPRVHDLFHVPNNCGASSLIIKRAALDDAIQTTSIGTLDILPSGPKPPNPLELLSWEATRELVATLKKEYEVIIIDCPSFNQTADSLVIAGLSDGAVLVVAKGQTKNAALGQVKKQLDNARVKLLGAVVNEREPKGWEQP